MRDIFPAAGEADYADQQVPIFDTESDNEVVPLAERIARAWDTAEYDRIEQSRIVPLPDDEYPFAY
ncbi:hypothetical protein ACWDYH_13005 [Nocardia goodfellowii]